MLTADHQLWRSTDYGKSWNNEMSKLPESDEVSSLERDSYNSGLWLLDLICSNLKLIEYTRCC